MITRYKKKLGLPSEKLSGDISLDRLACCHLFGGHFPDRHGILVHHGIYVKSSPDDMGRFPWSPLV